MYQRLPGLDRVRTRRLREPPASTSSATDSRWCWSARRALITAARPANGDLRAPALHASSARSAMAEGQLAKSRDHTGSRRRPASGRPAASSRGRAEAYLPMAHFTLRLLPIGPQPPGVECPESPASGQKSDQDDPLFADAPDSSASAMAKTTPAVNTPGVVAVCSG